MSLRGALLFLPSMDGIGKAKVYDFKRKRHGKYYEQKRVEIFYTIEESLTVTVTVYVFYGK